MSPDEVTVKKPFDPIMYIVVRGDIEMPAGKLAAQAGHAAVNAYRASLRYAALHDRDPASFLENRRKVTEAWIDNGGAKICVRVASVYELTMIKVCCNDLGIPAEIIEDAGHTVFDGPTVTCMGVGPLWRSEAGTLADLPLY